MYLKVNQEKSNRMRANGKQQMTLINDYLRHNNAQSESC